MISPSRMGDATFDVAVIGGGPAGASTAYHVARLGWRVVLLERSAFPRDKACGDGVSRASMAMLTAMGLGPALASHQRIRGTRLVSESKGSRDLPHPVLSGDPSASGRVVRRVELDHLIADRAHEAGAELWERATVTAPHMHGEQVRGVRVRRGEEECDARAKVVVAADGSTSRFARALGLVQPDPWSRGLAIRAYYTGIEGLDDYFTFHLPIPAPAGDRMLAGYGWVFPLHDGAVNLGVGYLPNVAEDFELNLRTVLNQFAERLRRGDSRFAAMRLAGRVAGAPLACGFDPAQCLGKRVLLVGDAAGLVDPFTGEGIDTALESGQLAAECIASALASPASTDRILAEYPARLGERYQDRFKTGHALVRTHSFLWRVVDETFESTQPLFESIRRTVAGYGASGSPINAAVPESVSFRSPARVAAGVEATRRRLLVDIESEFPLLYRICLGLTRSPGAFVRTSLAFLAAECGAADGEATAQVATAVELAYLAMLMHANVGDEEGGSAQVGNLFAVMAGDYLLVKAHETAAALGPRVSRLVSDAATEVCVGKLSAAQHLRTLDLDAAAFQRIMRQRGGTFYRIAARVGAEVASVSPAESAKLGSIGEEIGLASELADEIAEVFEERATTLDHPVVRRLIDGDWSWPMRAAMGGARAREWHALAAAIELDAQQAGRAVELLREDEAIDRTRELARRAVHRALGRIAAIRNVPVRRDLAALSEFVAARGAAAAPQPHLTPEPAHKTG